MYFNEKDKMSSGRICQLIHLDFLRSFKKLIISSQFLYAGHHERVKKPDLSGSAIFLFFFFSLLRFVRDSRNECLEMPFLLRLGRMVWDIFKNGPRAHGVLRPKVRLDQEQVIHPLWVGGRRASLRSPPI
jgi:hypothetical protein